MILMNPSAKILYLSPEPLRLIEAAGRTCYKSEDRITEDSAEKFCRMLKSRNHESVIEHVSMTVRFIVDRGVSHELVRHRLASFSQESTRYCDYGKKGLRFIIPPWETVEEGEYMLDRTYTGSTWFFYLLNCELAYNKLLADGQTPQQARAVLPNSLKTEVVMTANLREWMHVFRLRCSSTAHPQMREVMLPLRDQVRGLVPVLFDGDI